MFYGIHLRAISQEVLMNLIHNMYFYTFDITTLLKIDGQFGHPWQPKIGLGQLVLP